MDVSGSFCHGLYKYNENKAEVKAGYGNAEKSDWKNAEIRCQNP
jgi:hypothetical protein